MIKLNGVEIKLDKYPDGTFLFKDIPPIGGWCRDNIEWFFESMEELTAVEYITRYCWDHRVVPNLYMPYGTEIESWRMLWREIYISICSHKHWNYWRSDLLLWREVYISGFIGKDL